MKKRFLAVLMALSLVSTSALGNTGSITVHAEEVTEPLTSEDPAEGVSDETPAEGVSDETPSEGQEQSTPESGASGQTQESEESDSGASSSAASTASSEDSTEEEKSNEETNEESSDDSGNGESAPEDTVSQEQTEVPSDDSQNTDDLFNFDVPDDGGDDAEPSAEDMLRESKSDDVQKRESDGMVYWLEDGTLYITGTNIRQLNFANVYGVENIKSVNIDGKMASDAKQLFRDLSYVESIVFGEHTDTSSVKNMSCMFVGCKALKEIDLSRFDTSRVTSMYGMFSGCNKLKKVDLRGLDISSVTSMRQMFVGCSLEEIDLSGLDMSGVTDMYQMFVGCTALKKIDLRELDISSVAYMTQMFMGCKALEEVDLNGLKMSNAISTARMFEGCTALKKIDLSGVDMSGVKRSKTMEYMFYGCSALEEINLNGLNLTNVTKVDCMFFDCSSLKKVGLKETNMSSVLNMDDMFLDCSSLEEIDLSKVEAQSVRSMEHMFYRCSALKKVDLSGVDASDAISRSMENVFGECTSLKEIKTPKNLKVKMVFPEQYGIDDDYDYECDNQVGGIVVADNYAEPSSESHHYIKPGYTIVYPSSTYRATLYHKPDEGGTGTVELNLKRNWFYKSSTKYNHELARLACGLSLMAYSEEEVDYGTAIKKCLNGLNFHDFDEDVVTGPLYQTSDYEWYTPHARGGFFYKDKRDKENGTGGDKNTFWIGYTDIDPNTVLVAVVLRGTDGWEWYDDFLSGDGQDPETGAPVDEHIGFRRGADTVEGKSPEGIYGLKQYMKAYENIFEGKEVKILVTGHSRGAAVANLIGHDINSDPSTYGVKGKDDVYVYAFACPNVSKDGHESGHENIFNFVNPEDFVTKVMPALWGYHRYGKTYILPSQHATNPRWKYNEILEKARGLWQGYVGSTKKTYEPYGMGMGPVTEYVLYINSEVTSAFEYYHKNLLSLTGHETDKVLRDVFYDFLASNAIKEKSLREMEPPNGDLLSFKYGFLGFITAGYFGYNEGRKIPFLGWAFNLKEYFSNAHMCETYLAWMNTLEGEEDFPKETYYTCFANCPVDVRITNESGEVVGKIINDVPDDTDGVSTDGVVTGVNGESKVFVIPGTGNYHIELIGNDTGFMDYSVNQYNCDTLAGPRIYYHQLPLEKGKTYEMDIVDGATINNLDLLDEKGAVIEKTLISEEDTGKLTVEVSVDGNGAAGKDYYNLTQGDYVSLAAAPDEGAGFIGWYDENHKLLSIDAEYGFSIAKSEKLTARFSGSTGEYSQVDEPQNGEEPQNNEEPGGNGQQGGDNGNGNADNGNAQNVQSDDNQPAQNNGAANNQNTAGTEKKVLPVGTEFTSAGKVYRVTGDDTLAVVKLENKKAKTCSIPSSIVHEGLTYSVTEVGSKAFKGMKKLKSATIPSTVTKIGGKAFYNCPNLKKVTVKANSDLTVGKSAFKKVNKGCTIKVKGLKKNEKKAMVDKIKKQTNGKVK
ncbi:BspA family leucine-rich repeat surface protein [Butyrivibrio sp. FC2001]|uniref:BspA family leucine-rich repeat surface protein n=1 Tax=Butyrivibrio sp. FC2001 TaxID=1280671 RepID=UPI000407B649|nr:BspA family leucine-rich repeat surface protein [Butyrivibrio sp. FC2001]